ncbi:MAG: winged helix-turn-helix domain-containing protein [Stenotrophomonas sp.]
MNTSYTPPTTLYRWRFGPVEFDEAQRELRIAGLAVEMENRPLEVLSLLLRHVGEVVTKQELFDQIWAGRPTVDHVLSTAVGKLRKVLEAAGEPRIVTVPRIGYRFDGPVERVTVGQQAASGLELSAGQAVPERPHFQLERLLGRTLGSEVWLARQPRSRDGRVFKFALDGERLSAIKREATLARVLRDSLGERDDLARVLDWNFERPPFFLECEYGGQSLPEWAEQDGRLAALSREQRLHLFLQIADTVAAAHGVGVLHKDIKPSNVLVAAQGEGWRTRLTDFGNSRLLQPERLAELGITSLGLTTTRTDTSGTPLYLAPELIAGQSASIRSDLYALGVVLYQLVVGDLHQPLAPGWERGIDDELLAADIARATDLDPARRHASVAELAQQLRQLETRRTEQQQRQQDERDASALRQALERSRARRPWAIAAFTALVVGLVCSLHFWQRSERQQHITEQQRDIAEKQAARAEAVVEFLSNDLIGAVAPGGAAFERDPTVKDMLELASREIDKKFGHDPMVSGSIHAALGQSWRTLGEGERSVEELRAAIHDFSTALGADHELPLRTTYALVRTLAYVSRSTNYSEAGALLAEADAKADARLQQESELALDAAFARGIFHHQQLQIEQALPAWVKADALQRQLSPKDAQRAIIIRENLADALRRSGEIDKSIALMQAMLADPLLDVKEIGESHIASIQMNLARALRNQGKYSQALPLAEAAATTSGKIFGPDNYQTLVQRSTVASIHDMADNCPAAVPIQRDVMQRMSARYGEEIQATLVEIGNLGMMEYNCGDRSAGITLLRKAERNLSKRFGNDNAAAQAFRMSLAEILIEQGKRDEARRLLDELTEQAVEATGIDKAELARVRALLDMP